eukprot:1063190-Rhodomonas_salina.1
MSGTEIGYDVTRKDRFIGEDGEVYIADGSGLEHVDEEGVHRRVCRGGCAYRCAEGCVQT